MSAFFQQQILAWKRIAYSRQEEINKLTEENAKIPQLLKDIKLLEKELKELKKGRK